MNVAHKLPTPLNTFTIDLPANQYKDFELPPDSSYPLKGVTYPVDYGYIPEHTGEDGHELDIFVGNDTNGFCGSVLVDRGPDMPSEHKFYVALSKVELEKILSELRPVLLSHEAFKDTKLLISQLANFKNS